MRKNNKVHILFSVLFAQIGLVLGLFPLVVLEKTYSDGIASLEFTWLLQRTLGISVFALLFSVPFMVLIALPALYILEAYGKLSFKNIMGYSLLIPIVFCLMSFPQSFGIDIILPLIPTLVGAYLCWLYLSRVTSLTSNKTASLGTPGKPAVRL